MQKKLAAEFFGTFWLVLGGCGSAVIAAAFPNVGIGLLGVSFAFGLTVLTMAYAIGAISGCHLNPPRYRSGWSSAGALKLPSSATTSRRKCSVRSSRQRCFTSLPAASPDSNWA